MGKKHRHSSRKGRGRSKKSSSFVSRKPVLIGRVQKSRRGFAFILAQGTGVKDTYVSPQEALSLMNGDVVEFRIHHQGRRSEAEIVTIIERACHTFLGKVRTHQRGFYLETLENEIIELERADKNQVGQWALAQITQYPDRKHYGKGTLQKLLGSKLLPEHDHLITIARFGIQEEFNPQCNLEAEALRKEALIEYQKPSAERRDLRHLPFVTIDGEDAKDFDDAILVTEQTGQEAFTLYVAIADVSFFVRPGSRLDDEAQKRSTSTYFPGYCIPMLPHSLSNDLCSLNPKTDKLTLVAEMGLNQNGHVIRTQFYEAIIKTVARLTYTQVHAWFEGAQDALPQDCIQAIKSAGKLYEQLRKERKLRGVLDFQLPECRFELDEKGFPTQAYPHPSWESHQLIEEFMILANSAVAKTLKEAGCPSLYRIHEEPEIESIEELNHLMKSLGFSLMLKEVSPRAFSTILSQTTGKKGANTLHKAILRAQKQARYEPDPKGHFGLALKDYTHFTSPIRRYPDLIVHRSLKRFILNEKNADKQNESMDLVQLGELTSERERRAMEAERFIARRKQCWFMSKRVGETFSGVIAGVIAKGIFVEIVAHAIEGFIPVEALNGRYEFDERRGCMRRRPGHSTLSIGDSLNIQVISVDMDQNEITFSQHEESQ